MCSKGKISGQVFINSLNRQTISIPVNPQATLDLHLIDISNDTQSTFGDSQPGIDQLICID